MTDGSGMTREQALGLARTWAKTRVPAGPIAISWDERKQATNKRPLTQNGHRSFVTDLNRLDALFGSPMMTLVSGEVYGVGLHPGPANRVVLDVDTKGGKQGDVRLAALEAEHGSLPPHPIVDTASGGTHVWLTKPEGVHVGNPDLADGVEVRADDGWVVAPGTVTPWGSWTVREGTDVPAPLWPDWVAARLNGYHSGGTNRTTGRWQQLDRAALDPRDLAALEVMERLGGHGAVLGPGGEVRITRPGKQAGGSASIGYIDPGVVKVFTDDWAPLRKDAVYDVDKLEALASGDPQPTVTTSAPSTGTPSETGKAPPDAVKAAAMAVMGRYFRKEIGLLAVTLADDVVAVGPLAEGADDLVWSYGGGVWSPDRHVVRNRTAQLLGQVYRRSHGSTVEDIVRQQARRITCAPIGEVINFRNGLYLWQYDQLLPHSPEVLSTVQLSVDWNPRATCPAFDRWLAEVVPGDMIGTVWEFIGYLMYSGNPLHKAIMLHGNGRNGKGTLLRAMVALLGERNVTAVSLHDLVNTRFSTASLFGKIANIAGDIDATYLESTAMFKAITGQDQISAEHKGRDRFDFTPWAVPVFSANKVPASSDVTVGYLSRWLVIPFPHEFTGREDRGLDAKLQTKAELEGVAAKAVPALQRLLARGDFDLPASAVTARDEFARRVDQVRTWLDECCELNPERPFAPRTPLYEAYKAWTARDGHKPVKATEFYDRLEGAGVVPHRVAGEGTRGFLGIKVTDRAEGHIRA